jgi:glucose/arabinose dehydrogenase
MPTRNLIAGTDAGNVIEGTSQADLIYGFDPAGPQSLVTSIEASRVATGLLEPVFVGSPVGDSSRLFVLEKAGLIKIVDLGSDQVFARPFLDLTSTTLSTGEQGLLGLAFDPDFTTNGYFHVNRIALSGDTEVIRYRVSATDANVADPSSAFVIADIPQEAFTNHKAGWIGFGPDNYLYVALGDGGSGGDPNNNGQNGDSLLGKMLRIDIRNDAFAADAQRNYTIPADNPFVGTAGADEIWALGLRNPFRNSFDRDLGTFYIADVGQSAWEEVNVGQAGANYGWRVFEGPDTFQAGPLGPGNLTVPIFAYDHTVGASITGGYVYRGESDGLQGHYFYGDFVTGDVFTLAFDGTSWVSTERSSQIVTDAGSIANISSFGEDGFGNLYLVDFDGEIFRLTPALVSADASDVLRGLAGDDVLVGGTGDDDLCGGAGADLLRGGEGFDSARYDDAPAGVTASLCGGSGGEAAGDRFISIEALFGTDFTDSLTGDGAANILDGRGGDDRISGGGGADTVGLGAGADVLRDTLADLNGDRISGFGLSDAIEIAGSLIGRANFIVMAGTGSTVVGAGGTSFQLDGDFSGGDFMTVSRGSGANARTVVTFEPFLPSLSEGARVDPASINGVVNEPFLTGDGSIRFTLELKSAVSAHSNTLGLYKVATDGTIFDVEIVFANTLAVPDMARTVDLGVPGNDVRIGFFLIQDGFDLYRGLTGDLSFVTPGSTTPADIDSGVPPALRSATLGVLTGGPIFHSIATLNPADAIQVLSGVTPGGRELQIGFEDLTGTLADNDFQDVVFGIRVSPDDTSVL